LDVKKNDIETYVPPFLLQINAEDWFSMEWHKTCVICE